MKRTIPLLITALGGFVLVVAAFIPETEDWGEVAAIWFDILASIAFVLGGGNLLKVHLQKISDRAAGWGYSGITIIAFLVTLYFGLFKFGVPPAPEQEYFGETFARLPLEAFPDLQVAKVDGSLPHKTAGEPLPASVRWQMKQVDDELHFRGWMEPNQKADLIAYEDELDWRCTVERLAEEARPPQELRGRVAYYADHGALSFRGPMSDESEQILLGMSDAGAWQSAVDQLKAQSRVEKSVQLDETLAEVNLSGSLQDVLSHSPEEGTLNIRGPMSVGQREALVREQTQIARPLDGARREAFVENLEARGGPLSEAQRATLNKLLDGMWSVDQLEVLLNEAGQAQGEEKSYCELLEEKQAGATILEPRGEESPGVTLNDAQVEQLGDFASDETMSVDALVAALREAGEFPPQQESALRQFMAKAPSVGEFQHRLAVALRREGPLSREQAAFLTDEYQRLHAWRETAHELFLAAHQPKYRWSGNYEARGSAFGWIYEYVFKPLTATMFAMLAFYVASAAFRAFRAKNLEAILLLGTAFIILLGRTYAGVLLTSWIPEELAGLRVENMTVFIMKVFNTAGNRAIMIGVALGIASTSLKVLLGVDRSYLGSQEQ